MFLYHNVLNLKRLTSILECGFILLDDRIQSPCVYLTRNKSYMGYRGIRMVFDYDKLRFNYKVKPFSYRGWLKVNRPNSRFIPKADEMEERCYNKIDLKKTCVRIEIDSKIHKNIEVKHSLITVI